MARLVFLVLVVTLAACAPLEQPYREFARYNDELHAGGWVPDIFPHDIVKIREQHDLDTNRTWLTFQLAATSFDPEAANYTQLSATELSLLKLTSPARPLWRDEWWPKATRTKSRVYRRSDGSETTYIMIAENNEVYWWRV